MFALRALATRIAASSSIIPIIEPVNGNSNTVNSFDAYVEAGMRFVFVTNPKHGSYKAHSQQLHTEFCEDGSLAEYDNYVPAIYISRNTRMQEVNWFNENYDSPFRAVIYEGEPTSAHVRDWCANENRIYHHIILDGKVNAQFIQDIPIPRRVMIRDNFTRQARNADYPEMEHFTSMNTAAGNPDNVNWGDYSIQGDHFSDGGGAAMTVAIHHIHYSDNGESLDINHYLSDRQETTDDPGGKTIEAAEKLVADFTEIAPSDTVACNEYQLMVDTQHWKGLGYLKRLAIRHHLEVLLAND